jgi:hypothetical protein
MKRSSGPRKTASNLSESVHQQLNMYAIAAGAAGVSLLALTQPSEAKIVYTPANVYIGINQHYNLDLNHDRIIDFTIEDSFVGNGKCHTFNVIGEKANQVNGVLVGKGGLLAQYALALPGGVKIGASQSFPFGGNFRAMAIYNRYTSSHVCKHRSNGLWINVSGSRYLGLKFIFPGIHGQIHYGWARLQVNKSGHSFVAFLRGYAYETIAGKSIKAGQTTGPADDSTNEDFVPDASLTNPIPDTPQPASLGMLALGAQGVPLWRRKESVGATR